MDADDREKYFETSVVPKFEEQEIKIREWTIEKELKEKRWTIYNKPLQVEIVFFYDKFDEDLTFTVSDVERGTTIDDCIIPYEMHGDNSIEDFYRLIKAIEKLLISLEGRLLADKERYMLLALRKYANNFILEGWAIGFEPRCSSWMFEHTDGNAVVYSTPYYDNTNGIAIQKEFDGMPLFDGVMHFEISGDIEKDALEYWNITRNFLNLDNFGKW